MNSTPDTSHGLTKENFLATLPAALCQDKTMSALAAAAAEVLARRQEEIGRLRLYPAIDRLDERLLDILAYDFKVDWWDADYSLEEKRRTLKDSWRVHKLLGTKAAVETAISAIYPHTTVQEWFEYEGGKPYHFKLNIDLSQEVSDAARPWRVLERVNFYKSLRSHLEEIVFTMSAAPAVLQVGGGVGTSASIGVPAAEDAYYFRHALPIGGSFGADAAVGAPGAADIFDAQAPLYTGGAVSRQASIPVPGDAALPGATTILRTGGVCTIISNLSGGSD